jgi:ATP-binding cassette subfamily B protein
MKMKTRTKIKTKKKSDKIPVSERLSITIRAYVIIKKYCPGLMQSIVIQALVTALQPFATIYFSAQILNEIAQGDNIRKTIILAILVVGINFILSVIKGRIDIFHGEREAQMWCYFSKIFADKQLSMDFVDIEDTAIQKRKTKEQENLFFFGNGLGQFVWTIRSTIEGIVSIVVSIFMVISLFAAPSGNRVADSPLWIAAIAAVMALGIFINARAFKKNNDMFMAWCEKFTWFNRIFGFFGFTLCQEHERAKDARIYRQDISAEIELDKHIKKDKSDRLYYFKYAANESLASLFMGLNQVICYLFVVIKVFYGAFGIGSIVQYVGALGRLGNGLQQLVFGITDNTVYTQHLKSLFEFLDLPNRKDSGNLSLELVGSEKFESYEIEFKNISFKYPGTETYALRGLSLKFNIGEKLAVVGMNGSGKTTMIKLLCRLYDPDEGEITLNGVNIKEYRYDEYMSVFSVVFQDFKLFSFPLGQNVAVNVDVDERQALESLNQSGFYERFSTMPKGLDTALYKDFDESGVEISGGEAQKIALARALYKDAPFIVLDEPTAALDPMAEFEIYSTFNEIVGDKTAVYISHRLYSCRFCDEIIVFHEGELIQRGNHDTLVADKNGKYYELWNAQAQYYSDNSGGV